MYLSFFLFFFFLWWFLKQCYTWSYCYLRIWYCLIVSININKLCQPFEAIRKHHTRTNEIFSISITRIKHKKNFKKNIYMNNNNLCLIQSHMNICDNINNPLVNTYANILPLVIDAFTDSWRRFITWNRWQSSLCTSLLLTTNGFGWIRTSFVIVGVLLDTLIVEAYAAINDSYLSIIFPLV